MISITKLTLAFGKRKIFQGIQAQFPSSGLIGIEGPSGSGKTTLFKILMGLQDFKGMIRIRGVSLSSLTAREKVNFRRSMFGWIAQDFTMFMTMTVLENLLILAQIKGFEIERDRRAEVSFVIKVLRLETLQFQILGTLSGGQRQRVAFASALIGRPPILIADEPFSHLDHEQEQLAMQSLKALSKHHLILISSHHTEVLTTYCDEKISVVPQGRFVTQRSTSISGWMHTRSMSKLPFRAIWSLIQSMKLGKSISSLLEWLSVAVILIVATLAMILRMVTMQIQTEIQLRLGDGLSTLLRQENPIANLINKDQFDHLKTSISIPTVQLGVMGKMPLDTFDHQLYLVRGSYSLAVPDFNLHGFLQGMLTSEIANIQSSSMSPFELSLGLTPFLYEWAQIGFKTTDLKSYLQEHTPRLILKTSQPNWQYEDEVGFDWVDVTITPYPMIIHSDPLFIEKLIHEHMQIPLWNEEIQSPLFLELLPMVHVPNDQDKQRLKEQLAEHDVMLDRLRFGQHAMCPLIERCNLKRYALYNTPYALPSSWLRQQKSYLPLSSSGLVRIEEAFIYGFQKKMYMSDSLPLLQYVQDITFREKEQQSFGVYESTGLYSSYAFAPSSKPIIWKPGLEEGGVYLSRDLQTSISGSTWHFLYEFHRLPLGDGFVQMTYRIASLPILGYFDSPSSSLWIHPKTFDHLMIELLEQSAVEQFPTGFVVDKIEGQPPSAWMQSNALKDSQTQTEQWVHWITYTSLGLGFITAMPLLGLLIMLYDLKSEPLRKQGKILIHHGLPREALVQVFQLEIMLFFLRWWLPIVGGMLAMSVLLKVILNDFFSFPITYIPWIEIGSISGALLILGFWVTRRFNHQLIKY